MTSRLKMSNGLIEMFVGVEGASEPKTTLVLQSLRRNDPQFIFHDSKNSKKAEPEE